MSKHYKILLGGSPCTYWSISQSSDKRETEASGVGWELFRNYLIAKEKFKPDYFLYENNKSMAKPIRNQIDVEFNRTYAENTNWELISSVEEDKGHTKRWLWRNKTTGKTEYITRILINSALVSAQNRQRYYWTNIPNVPQPQDRGILLRDVLDSVCEEKGYALRIPDYGISDKARPLGANYSNNAGAFEQRIWNSNPAKQQLDYVAEPIRIGTIEHDGGYQHDSKQHRVYLPDGKSTTLCGQGGGVGAKTGLYACPTNDVAVFTLPHGYQKGIMSYDKSPTITTGTAIRQQNPVIVPYLGEVLDDSKYKIINKIYTVENGLITIKDKQYPIKLPDGYYIIRKLTVNECRRLQTIPDWYKMPCSASQNYKMLGNGWTIEVIKHILSFIPSIADCTVEVLSMYDGMSCGQITLAELGCQVERYVSYEIDKYAIQTTQANFARTEQRGDAFQLRNTNWSF